MQHCLCRISSSSWLHFTSLIRLHSLLWTNFSRCARLSHVLRSQTFFLLLLIHGCLYSISLFSPSDMHCLFTLGFNQPENKNIYKIDAVADRETDRERQRIDRVHSVSPFNQTAKQRSPIETRSVSKKQPNISRKRPRLTCMFIFFHFLLFLSGNKNFVSASASLSCQAAEEHSLWPKSSLLA